MNKHGQISSLWQFMPVMQKLAFWLSLAWWLDYISPSKNILEICVRIQFFYPGCYLNDSNWPLTNYVSPFTECYNIHGDDDECDGWATDGECALNSDWMLVNCNYSCGCLPPPPTSSTSTPPPSTPFPSTSTLSTSGKTCWLYLSTLQVEVECFAAFYIVCLFLHLSTLLTLRLPNLCLPSEKVASLDLPPTPSFG